ncbi:MAG TPA: type II secretion system major pseudopilin GspG [Chthoniobacterales bacterium]|jgi:general secretion pathway protein G
MKKREQGFTLLEIMIVVTIISLLMAAAIYNMMPSVDVAKKTRIVADIGSIRTMLLSYQGMNGFYPTTDQGLQALVVRPESEPIPNRWTQMMSAIPTDPWGKPYVYRCPGNKNPNGYDVYSAGPDRIPDTADDDWGQ